MNSRIPEYEAFQSMACIYQAMDPTQQSLVAALAWIALFSAILNVSLKASRHLRKKKVEDPFQVVMNQPVGKVSNWNTSPVKTELGKKSQVRQIRRRTQANKSNHQRIQLKLPKLNPSFLEKRQRQKLPVTSAPPLASKAVAELDFIRSATSQDLLALKDRFGSVYVASDSYPDVVSTLRARRHDFLEVFLPMQVDDQRFAYSGIALAGRIDAMVLSESENVKRICCNHGIACMDLAAWRNAASGA
jgi:hypothetical protein